MDKYVLFLIDFSASSRAALVSAIGASQRFILGGDGVSDASGLVAIASANPDVVVVDLTAESGDGLALVRQLQVLRPTTAVVLLNEARDFETAHAAIDLGVTAYWVAPLILGQVKQHLARLQITLDDKRQKQAQFAALQRDYAAVLPLRRRAFMINLIEGQVGKEELNSQLAALDWAPDAPYFACFVVHTSHTQLPRHASFAQLLDLVRRSTTNYFDKRWQTMTVDYQNDTVIVIGQNLPMISDELAAVCSTFVAAMKRLYGAVITIGVGQLVDSLDALAQAYASGRTALSYRSVVGTVGLIEYDKVAVRETTSSEPLDSAALWHLLKLVHSGSKSAISRAIDGYLTVLEHGATTVSQHTVAVADMLGSLYRFAQNNELRVEAFAGDLKSLYSTVVDYTPESLRLWLLDVCTQFSEQLNTPEHTASDLVLRAIDYVHEHYADEDLSLGKICQDLSVSNAYFSSQFKKQTGTSFIAYLTDYRMQVAARLLLETREKSHVIGSLVGFSDANYFSTVFKRHFGESPAYYRQTKQSPSVVDKTRRK